ncbi:hypothetical protein IAI10_02455 [Clostridium sp. 19966]|uniref:hypothetical protein n=1 Tax=Clostridium sp. 19966 TaxID=2768166 RepID=UPI0028DDE5BC|nr:hypothetical protein [Clostridium sp. 19966]MDT8715520.1 hypothetical protein [Clostridium sp. 19966]
MNIRTGINLDKEMKKLIKFSKFHPYMENYEEHPKTNHNKSNNKCCESNSVSENMKYIIPAGIAVLGAAALVGYGIGKNSR